MFDCKNCYWYGHCNDVQNLDTECEYFDPVEITAEIEYEEDLRMRAEVYNDYVREMQR